jgi:uncharacterized membrane protein
MLATHVHLILNHVPILLVPLAGVILALGYKKANPTLRKVAYSLLVLAAAVSIPVFLTGEPAEDVVENLPQVSEALIEEHEEAAETAYIATLATGAFALLGFALFFRRPGAELHVAKVVMALSLVGSGLLFYTGNLGGQIRHSEIRADATSSGPANLDMSTTEDKEDDDD